jgi:hypothetical protein
MLRCQLHYMYMRLLLFFALCMTARPERRNHGVCMQEQSRFASGSTGGAPSLNGPIVQLSPDGIGPRRFMPYRC